MFGLDLRESSVLYFTSGVGVHMNTPEQFTELVHVQFSSCSVHLFFADRQTPPHKFSSVHVQLVHFTSRTTSPATGVVTRIRTYMCEVRRTRVQVQTQRVHASHRIQSHSPHLCICITQECTQPSLHTCVALTLNLLRGGGSDRCSLGVHVQFMFSSLLGRAR